MGSWLPRSQGMEVDKAETAVPYSQMAALYWGRKAWIKLIIIRYMETSSLGLSFPQTQ